MNLLVCSYTEPTVFSAHDKGSWQGRDSTEGIALSVPKLKTIQDSKTNVGACGTPSMPVPAFQMVAAVGLLRWSVGKRAHYISPTAWVLSPEPRERQERTDFPRLPPLVLWYAHCCIHIYILNEAR